MASEIIGLGPCINCGATVEYKMNVAARAFYRCNGSADKNGKACGLEIKQFGAVNTQSLVEKLSEVKAHAVKGRSNAGGASRPAKTKSAPVEDGDGNGSEPGDDDAKRTGNGLGYPYD